MKDAATFIITNCIKHVFFICIEKPYQVFFLAATSQVALHVVIVLLITRIFAGQKEGLTRDDILDNITLYWVTNTAVSSARLYWEATLVATSGFFDPRNVTIPVAVSSFPDEIYAAPKTWAEKAYPKLIHYNKLNIGGHFAAWEQPQLFVEELRASFKSLR